MHLKTAADKPRLTTCLWVVLSVSTLLLTGCQSAYYGTMEKLGYHKRDLLVDRVEEARDSQQAAKEQFQTALEQFSSVVNFEGGDLEKKYRKLNREYQRSEAKADGVSDRIDEVEKVSKALFKEWEAELSEYSNENLRRASEAKLEQTRQRYDQLIDAMHRAESKIDPVLSAFKDQVLYLKHNLNAQAIASLRDELTSVETDIASLIREMEASVAEANAFIEEIGTE